MGIREQIAEYNEEAILFDGLDDAIIGVGQQHGMHTVAIYDRDKCIDILFKSFMTEDADEEDTYLEAVEYFDFNVGCLYAGENTPIILQTLPDD